MRKRFNCPACGSALDYTGSHLKSDLLRQTYAQCRNPDCQGRWVIFTEVAQCLTPPLAPFKNPLPSNSRNP